MSTVPISPPRVRKATSTTSVAAEVIALEEHGIEIPVTALTLEGYRAWAQSESFPERGRIVFLGGRLSIDMSPESFQTHANLKVEIGRVLPALVRKHDLGEFYPDGVWLTNAEVGLSTEADAAFGTWHDLESGRLVLVPREGDETDSIEMQGTPSWVLEIVSNSSVRKDTQTLRDLYYRAGIDEYWLIDARGEDLSFEILVRGESDYEAAAGRNGWVPSAVFRRRFRLTRRRGRMHHWQYTLDVKAIR